MPAMHIQDFVKIYQAKSDEELIQLASNQEELVPDAELALKGELSRRQINAPRHSGDSPRPGHDGSHGSMGDKLQDGQRLSVGDFVAEVLRSYHDHFWLFFRITAPAVTIGTIAIVIGRNEGLEIARHIPRGIELLEYRTEIVEIWLANLSAWLVSWMAFSCAFGATCIALEEIASGFTPSAWQSFLNIRERFGPFLRLSLLLFFFLLVVEAVVALLETGVFWVLRQWHVHPTRFLITLLSFILVGLGLLFFSRFALAVPAVLLDDCRVGKAMFRSDEFTQGKWLTLVTLLAKSVVGGYVAAMWPFWMAAFVPVTVPLPLWFPWVLTCASIIGVTVVEPTMFVGFALLYLKMSALTSAPRKILNSQLG